MKNEHKNLEFYRNRYNFYKVAYRSMAFGVALMIVIAFAGWYKNINEKKDHQTTKDLLKSEQKRCDSLLIERNHYKSIHFEHFKECVESKVMSDYEEKMVNKIKRK